MIGFAKTGSVRQNFCSQYRFLIIDTDILIFVILGPLSLLINIQFNT